MKAPLYTAHISRKVLMLSEAEGDLRTEANTLRSLGASGLTPISGPQELFDSFKKESKEGRGEKPADLIICHELLAGKSIYFFLKELSIKKEYAQIPILIVVSSPGGLVAAKECGLYAIERPYNQETMEKALARCMSPMRRPLSQALLEKYCQSLESRKEEQKKLYTKSLKPEPRTTSDYFQSAVKKLHQDKEELAEKKLFTVLERDPEHVDAYLHLAKISRARGDSSHTQKYLIRACAASLRARRLRQAMVIKDILPEKIKKGGIFFYEALGYLKEEKYSQAASSFLDQQRERPEQSLREIVARACQMTKGPEANLDEVCKALLRIGYPKIAEKLRKRMFFKGQDYGFGRQASWLDKHPRLREFIGVASYTLSLWRQA